jgi:hypothetical protein
VLLLTIGVAANADELREGRKQTLDAGPRHFHKLPRHKAFWIHLVSRLSMADARMYTTFACLCADGGCQNNLQFNKHKGVSFF